MNMLECCIFLNTVNILKKGKPFYPLCDKQRFNVMKNNIGPASENQSLRRFSTRAR